MEELEIKDDEIKNEKIQNVETMNDQKKVNINEFAGLAYDELTTNNDTITMVTDAIRTQLREEAKETEYTNDEGGQR